MIVRVEPGGPDKMKVFANDEYIMTVNASTWYSLGYGNSEEMSYTEFEALQFVIDGRKAYNSAVRMLALRAHSEHELRQKLLLKGYEKDLAEHAINKCKELGFIDDLDFGIRYGTELVRKKRYGPLRLRNELVRKGLSRENVIDAMVEIDFDSTSCILEIIEKKYSTFFDCDKNKRKMVQGIMNLGYTFSDIEAAIAYHNEITDGEKYEL